jgi:hypothetical protein
MSLKSFLWQYVPLWISVILLNLKSSATGPVPALNTRSKNFILISRLFLMQVLVINTRSKIFILISRLFLIQVLVVVKIQLLPTGIFPSWSFCKALYPISEQMELPSSGQQMQQSMQILRLSRILHDLATIRIMNPRFASILIASTSCDSLILQQL